MIIFLKIIFKNIGVSNNFPLYNSKNNKQITQQGYLEYSLNPINQHGERKRIMSCCEIHKGLQQTNTADIITF